MKLFVISKSVVIQVLLVLVKDYATFKKHFIDKGLRWDRQIGQRVYYRKKDLLDFVEVTGERYPEIRTTLKGPREKTKREFVTLM